MATTTSSKSTKIETVAGRRLPERVAVGLVTRPHAVSGEVLVESLTDVAQRFAPGARLLVQGHSRELEVAAARAHKGRLLVRFVGIDDRDAALALRGIVLEVPRSAVAPAPDGVYYHFELIACQVFDREAGELGRVKDVLEDGGGLLLEIEGAGRTLLLPFVRAYLVAIDVEAGRIELALPEGLIATCASTS